MVFATDDLAAWPAGGLADAGRKKLAALVLGTGQEWALRAVAAAAVQRTAAELRRVMSGAAELAMVVGEVFAGRGSLRAPAAADGERRAGRHAGTGSSMGEAPGG